MTTESDIDGIDLGIEQLEVDWLILADHAEVIGGKLYMNGGGWNRVATKGSFPVTKSFSVALAIRVPWTLTNKPAQVRDHRPERRRHRDAGQHRGPDRDGQARRHPARQFADIADGRQLERNIQGSRRLRLLRQAQRRRTAAGAVCRDLDACYAGWIGGTRSVALWARRFGSTRSTMSSPHH